MSITVPNPGRLRARSSPILTVAVLVAAVLAGAVGCAPRQEARVVPPAALDEPAAEQDTSQVAVLAGGCFWGVQGVYQHVKGVTSAVSGYAGGQESTARYDEVERGRSGHAEAVQVTFDPRQISYGRLLQLFFSVVHDPTQLDRQGPDVGPQYRSAIFPQDAEQESVARAYVAQLEKARVFDAAMVTEIEPNQPFYRAEDSHQDFVKRHPALPYVVAYELPKIDDLERLFPERYRPTPVLVGAR
jgi:peptide-methionine (S)-S-oxide reductase